MPERVTEKFDSERDSPDATIDAIDQWQRPGDGLAPKKHPLMLLYTGHGKGKTSSALGVTMRAWGRGWRVVWLQFIKARTSRYGETRAAERMGIEMIPLGDGFTWLSKDIEQDKALAREGWRIAREKLDSGAYDLVVFDEITYPLTYGWLDVDEVIEALRDRPAGVHVILTGRDAPQPLADFADLVTEMREVRHPYQQGIRAQPGIDY
jgi:cob(I)alamin adenosyltransferase